MHTGEILKSLRRDRGITQKYLAELTGLATITIQGYEAGKYKPKLEQLRRIAAALEIPVGDLIDDWNQFSQAEIIRDMADEDNGYFWTSYLDNKLKQVGCKLIHDEDNYQTWIEFPDGAQEVTDSQLKELDSDTVDYLNFKLSELRKKNPDDFRRLDRRGIEWKSTAERLNYNPGKK